MSFYIWGVRHWRHLANSTEKSACDGDAALCQITLNTCYYHYIDTLYVYITIIISQFAARRKASRDNLSSVTKLNGRTVITVAVVRKAKLVFKKHSSVYSPDTTKAESKRERERERESRERESAFRVVINGTQRTVNAYHDYRLLRGVANVTAAEA